MGIYNCAETLVEALDSIENQTYKDFKIVICDDGSTDDTYSVASDYISQHDNIILLRNGKNMKLAYTLNKCLEYADTEYVARMDGDDISLPERFEKEINYLDNHPEFALVSCPILHFDETGIWMKGGAKSNPEKEDFTRGTPFPHAPSMIRTSVLKEVGGYTNNKYTVRSEDYDLWAKIYLAGYKGHNLSEHLYMFRNDDKAFARRRPINRWYHFLLMVKVKRALGLSHPIYTSLPELAKMLVPNPVARILKKRSVQRRYNKSKQIQNQSVSI